MNTMHEGQQQSCYSISLVVKQAFVLCVEVKCHHGMKLWEAPVHMGKGVADTGHHLEKALLFGAQNLFCIGFTGTIQ